MYGTDRIRLVVIRCVCCEKWQVVRLDPDDLERHAAGALVQVAFARHDGTPYLTRSERELFISACCRSCWDLLCPDPMTHPTAYN
jgi:hypothetical protein